MTKKAIPKDPALELEIESLRKILTHELEMSLFYLSTLSMLEKGILSPDEIAKFKKMYIEHYEFINKLSADSAVSDQIMCRMTKLIAENA